MQWELAMRDQNAQRFEKISKTKLTQPRLHVEEGKLSNLQNQW
jgi:hypothetical protein